MTDRDDRNRDFWARYREDAAVAGAEPAAAPDDETLAAWLDGRLDLADSAPVERWLADDPAALAFVMEFRTDPSGAAMPAPSRHAVARAQALVPARRAGEPSRSAGLFARLFSPVAGAALAAMLVAAVGGFELGAATFTDIDAVDDEVAAEIWPAENVSLDDEAG